MLNYEEIQKFQQGKREIRPFIAEYNWEGTNYPSERNDWKKFDKNNQPIALKALYAKNEKIYPAHVAKHNSKCEKQIILLMIPKVEEWH